MSKIPSNLKKIFEGHNECKDKGFLAEIGGHPEWQEHVRLIAGSIRLIELLVHGHGRTDEELFAKRCLGSRLYNDCATAYILILSGYYQASTAHMRDALECSLILELFTADRSEIKRWRKATRKESMSYFKFGAMRRMLEKKYGVTKELLDRIDTIHKILCEYGVHPTYKSIVKMQFKDSRLYYGSFYNKIQCGHFLAELARISSFAVHELVKSFGRGNIDKTIQNHYLRLTYDIEKWVSKYDTFPSPADAKGKRVLD